ncbi:MAG: hypothetical protein HZB26_00650 [Candidatus Hydrogenedentes bacterium]|nr:hypothetical protein [Candidatus Hydrogenedentota bacterium]
MTVFVTIETCQGIVSETRVFLTDKSARKAERKWLKANGIKDDENRQGKSDNGTECLRLECKLEP